MRVEISDRAKNELAEIIAFLEQRSPRAADLLSDTLEAAILRLGDFPEMGRPKPEFGAGVQILISERYIIAYVIETTAVLVLRVLDGRMDIEAQLDP